MMPKPNRQGEIWLNVASSTCVEPGFVNLDNHLFLPLIHSPKSLLRLLPAKYRGFVDEYRNAASKASLLRHDCRKPLPVGDASVDHILCSHFLEHVYPAEAAAILRDFRRVLKPGATLHVIVPDLAIHVEDYLAARRSGDRQAGNAFIDDLMLSKRARGTRKFRLLDAMGGFGLNHLWVYDYQTITDLVSEAGFLIDEHLKTPSDHVRTDDGISTHVKARA